MSHSARESTDSGGWGWPTRNNIHVTVTSTSSPFNVRCQSVQVLDGSAYETPPPNSIHSPFSKQIQFNQVLLHTLIRSSHGFLPLPLLPKLQNIHTLKPYKWTPHPPDHHSFCTLLSCHIFHFHSPGFTRISQDSGYRPCMLSLSLWEKLPMMSALKPVPWTLPMHNVPLLLMLFCSSSCTNEVSKITELVYAFQLIIHCLLHGLNFSKQLPINTPRTSETNRILQFTPSINPPIALNTTWTKAFQQTLHGHFSRFSVEITNNKH